MPPSRAMASAISQPVTLSMLADTIGSSISRAAASRLDSAVARRDSATPCCGRNRKSSKVRPIQAGSSSVWLTDPSQSVSRPSSIYHSRESGFDRHSGSGYHLPAVLLAVLISLPNDGLFSAHSGAKYWQTLAFAEGDGRPRTFEYPAATLDPGSGTCPHSPPV